MKYKTVWYPVDGSDPVETTYDTLAEVASAITDNPGWETQARGYYVDWVDDGGTVEP